MSTINTRFLQARRMKVNAATPTDGNCLFHAIVDTGSCSLSYQELRMGAINNAPTELVQLAAMEMGCRNGMSVSVADYVIRMLGDGEWAGHAEVGMCARFLGRDITVVTETSVRTFTSTTESEGWSAAANAVAIVYYGKSNHYYGTSPT